MKKSKGLLAEHPIPLLRACALLAVLLQSVIVVALQSSAQETLEFAPTLAGPVAAYSFDEGSGTTVTDASGNGNNGIITGATWTNQGKFGNALSFTAPDWVTVNDSNTLDLTSGMTLEAWIFPTAVTGNWTTVIFKEQPEVNNQVYGLYGSSPSTLPLIDVYTDTIHELYGPTPLPLNDWTFLAATYDAVNGLSLFVNGAQVAHLTVTGNMVTSTGPLRMGGNSLFGEYFEGIIDNVRIYNRALSQTEIQIDMNLPVIGVMPTPTPGSTASPTPTATATHSPTPTATATHSPTPTATATHSPTPTATATHSPTPTATATHSPTPTATATHSPTATATAVHSPTPTATAVDSPTPTATAAHSPTPTPPPSPTPTPGPCAWSSDYWANHPEVWCLESIQIGCVDRKSTRLNSSH